MSEADLDCDLISVPSAPWADAWVATSIAIGVFGHWAACTTYVP